LVQIKSHDWFGTELIGLYGEGRTGSPTQQFEALVEDCWKALAQVGLVKEDLVFSRLWMRDRSVAKDLNEVRERLLRGSARSASSSFYSQDHFVGEGVVALDLLACRARRQETRRLVDFTPPRRYAHYLAQDDWLLLSGMAEDHDDMDAQFDKAFAEVCSALDKENMEWRHVVDATLFLERGRADISWLRQRFLGALSGQAPRVSFEYVDGLATPSKNLEIEIIAHASKIL
jgi:enamine deaminase RidA (YjgF/YER057c/UK114 family)